MSRHKAGTEYLTARVNLYISQQKEDELIALISKYKVKSINDLVRVAIDEFIKNANEPKGDEK
jgi:hypothetical protein